MPPRVARIAFQLRERSVYDLKSSVHGESHRSPPKGTAVLALPPNAARDP
jgi:hypothetical protein